MTTLVRWTPFAHFSGLHRAMDVLEHYAPIQTWRNPEAAELTFPVDLSETADKVTVKVSDGELVIKTSSVSAE